MRRFTSICCVALVAFLPARVGLADYTSEVNDKVVITLERTTCFGTCPAYKLTISGNGSVVYEGRKFVRVSGLRQSKLDRTTVAGLLQSFVRIQFFDLKDSYGSEKMITDLETTYVSLSFGGRSKRIKDYFGAPKPLRELERSIDDIVGSKRWVTIDASAVHDEAQHGWDLRSLDARRLLLTAAQAGDVEVVEAFLQEGADPNTEDNVGQNILNYVARGLEYQNYLSEHPRPDEDPLPNYAGKYADLKRMVLAAGGGEGKPPAQ